MTAESSSEAVRPATKRCGPEQRLMLHLCDFVWQIAGTKAVPMASRSVEHPRRSDPYQPMLLPSYLAPHHRPSSRPCTKPVGPEGWHL